MIGGAPLFVSGNVSGKCGSFLGEHTREFFCTCLVDSGELFESFSCIFCRRCMAHVTHLQAGTDVILLPGPSSTSHGFPDAGGLGQPDVTIQAGSNTSDGPQDDGASGAASEAPDFGTDSSSSSATRWAPIGGGVAAGFIILLLSLCTCVVQVRRRRCRVLKDSGDVASAAANQMSGRPGHRPPHACAHNRAAYGSNTVDSAAGKHGDSWSGEPSKDTPDAGPEDGAQSGTGLQEEVQSADLRSRNMSTNSAFTTTGGVMPTSYNTSLEADHLPFMQKKHTLGRELDYMRQSDERFLGQFAVLPWTERREGGQGVVQIMRSVRQEEFVAVKFFLSRTAFDAELELYRVEALRNMMPEIKMEVSNNESSAIERNSRGYPWPPCIVLEKGESLQEWKAKTRPAFSTIVDVRPTH